MRNQSAKTPLAITVFLALLSFGVAQQKTTSAAEAGISQSDDSRAKALLHPADENGVERGEKAKVLLRRAAAEYQEKKPAPKRDLSKEIAAVLSQPPLNRAHWGVDVVDLETGKALYSQNSDQLFLPASNAKLFTTAAALAIADRTIASAPRWKLTENLMTAEGYWVIWSSLAEAIPTFLDECCRTPSRRNA